MEIQIPSKIAIWGTVASGKTTLTKQLSSILKISNTIHTDEIFNARNYSSEEIELIVSQVDKQLRKATWIIDGNLNEQFEREEIAKNADMIIILYYPISLLLKRMIFRDGKLILDYRKPPHVKSIRQLISYKIQLFRWFFGSLSIINNFNSKFIHQIRSIIEKGDVVHKTFIISSRQNLEKY